MKPLSSYLGGLLACAVWIASPVSAATLSLQRVGSGSVSPGSTVTVDVFVDGVVAPNFLRGYQVTLLSQAVGGTTGTLSLAPSTLTGLYTCLGGTNDGVLCTVANSVADCPGGSCSGPNFIDEGRADWVYASLPPGSALTAVIPNALTFGATLLDSAGSVEVPTPRYLGTLIFQASVDALGSFTLSFDPNPDVTFLIDVASFDAVIPFTSTSLTIAVANAAPNDSCDSPVTAFDGVTPFTTQNATTDGPSHPGSGCDTGDGGLVENDIWFDYTASCSGVLTVTTCNDADFDTRLAVYSVCTCPALDANLLACNDNGAGCSGGTSEVTVAAVTQGTCYKIRIGGAGGLTGSGNLSIACVPNDTCPTAQTVSVPSTTNGATLGATVDVGLPACPAAVDSPGVWYTVTGNGGVMTASLCSAASYDTQLSVFQGACGALTCVAGANDTCGNRESISWCSTVGTPYFILVHGVAGARGTFTLDMSSTSCNDVNACTTDTCSAGVCSNIPTFVSGVECCNPSNGAIQVIDDVNPCTTDACNASTGQVSHTPVPNGENIVCDDSLGCTVDECFNGACRNTPVADLNIPCTTDANCPGDSVCGPGTCVCGSALELIASPGSLPVAGCYAIGDQLIVRVDLAFVSADRPIVGGQFFLAYDATALSLVSIEPGQTIEPTSPFAVELNESVDNISGTIDYLVSVNIGQQGATQATTLAVATFDVVQECAPFVVFRLTGPNGATNLLSSAGGTPIVPGDLTGLPLLSSDDSQPVLTGCPSNITVSSDPGSANAIVTWAAPSSVDSCDGPLPVTCTPASGSAFSAGTTQVVCNSTNSCGLTGSCAFNVSVTPSTVTTSIQLSPTMAAGPFTRCITFDLWDCDAVGGPERHSTVEHDVTFVGGQAFGVSFDIPGGGWDCMTARDPLHTLRSTATDFATADGVNFTGTFTGDRAAAGHWLVGGNLNDDAFIDVLDFGVFVNEFLKPATPNTPCGTPTPDGNVSGDNVIDLVDFVFVQVNSFAASEPNCCGGPLAQAQTGPIYSISIRDLQRRGLYYLAPADLNRDGVLDDLDIVAFMNGVRPSGEYVPARKKTRRDASLRETRSRTKPGR